MPVLRPLRLQIPARIIRQFKKLAKTQFPKEAYAFVLGKESPTTLKVEELWIPEDLTAYTTRSSVSLPKHWYTDAWEYAQEHDLDPLGDIHSHPFSHKECEIHPGRPEAVPSEADFKTWTSGVNGICVVTEGKTGRLRANIRFWGPMVPFIEEVI